MKGLGLESIGDPGKVTQDTLRKFSADVFKQASKADALLVSCGGLRTLEILAPLEKETACQWCRVCRMRSGQACVCLVCG